METGALWRWAAAVGFAAGGLIAACWVSAELGVVTLVWAPACVQMRRSRGGVCGGVAWGFLSVLCGNSRAFGLLRRGP